METVIARLEISVYVDCPYCDETLIDLACSEHDDEGYIMKQACPDGVWYEEHKKFTVDNVICPACHKSFNVKELEW